MTSEKRFDIVSVGDCVMDCISYVDRLPKMGETMMSKSFICSPGGKGANSIVASSRLGSKCTFICKLGDDMFGKNFIDILKAESIDTSSVTFTTEGPTSVASILVDNDGHNAIAVNFGATLLLKNEDVDQFEDAIKASKILVTTMMARNATLHALKAGKKNGLLTIFNFAPAVQDLDQEYNKYVDLLVVNEVEAEVFSGCEVKSLEDAKKACSAVLARDGFYIGVIVTLGENGIVFGNKKTNEIINIPAIKVQAVDSTGAGDAFVGSLAHFIGKLGVETESLNTAIKLACEYASLSVLKPGTQASYPKLAELDAKFNL